MRTSHLFNAQIWSQAIWGENTSGVHTKSGTLQQTKSEKSESKALLFPPLLLLLLFLHMKCCLLRVGAGQREGFTGRGEWLSHSELMHKWTVIVGREWRVVLVGGSGGARRAHAGGRSRCRGSFVQASS